jgi:hypothetical protein
MRAQSVGRFIRIGRGYTQQQQQPLSGSQYVADNVYKCTRCPRASLYSLSQHHKVDIIKHTVLLQQSLEKHNHHHPRLDRNCRITNYTLISQRQLRFSLLHFVYCVASCVTISARSFFFIIIFFLASRFVLWSG